MTDFESYMKMNVHYEYLQKYYNSEDIASIYGVSKYEIKRSNVLSWILNPKRDEAIDYLPIRNLLKLIQEKNSYYDFFNELDLNITKIDKVQIQREKYNIDILITFRINNEDYLIVLENKLEALIHDDQLNTYKSKVEEVYTRHKKLYVFLHPGINSDSEKEALINRTNSDLVNNLGNLVNRTISMSHKYFDGIVVKKNLNDELDNELINSVTELHFKVDKVMNSLHVDDALNEIFDTLRKCNEYIDEATFWVLAKDETKYILGKAWKESPYVFKMVAGGCMKPDWLSKTWKTFLDNNNMRSIRLHDLRHTCATYLLSIGTPIATVSRKLGHSDIYTTYNTYTHSLEKDDKEAVEKLADRLFR